MIKDIITDHTMLIDQKFGMISLSYRELGDSLIWQTIIVITNFNMFCIHFQFILYIPITIQYFSHYIKIHSS